MQETPDLLLNKNFTTGEIRFWNGIQRSFAAQKLILVEYDPEQYDVNYWQMYIGPEKGKKLARNIQSQDIQLKLNDDLQKCFSDPKFRANKTFWKNMSKLTQWRGCFIPYPEIQKLEKKDLRNYLTILQLQCEYFPFVDFLTTIKQQSILLEKQNIPLPVIVLWYYFIFYTDFLKEIAFKEPERFEAVKAIYSEHFSSRKFDEKLPSEQIIGIITRMLELTYLKTKDRIQIDRMLQQADHSVQTFFKLYHKNIQEYVDGEFVPLKKVEIRDRENKLRDHFFSVCLEDLNFCKIQELLDDRSGNYFLSFFSETYQDDYGKYRKRNLTSRLKALIGDDTIMERIQAMADNIKINPKPQLVPMEKLFSEEDEQQWHQLSVEERKNLLETCLEVLPEIDAKELDDKANDRWLIHLENILNRQTMPFMIWENYEGQLIPQWNCFGTESAKRYEEEFWKKRAKEKAELNRLETILAELYKIENKYTYKKFITGIKGFSYVVAQDRWKQALEQHLITLENRSSYRIRRMREFGILEPHEKLNDRKEMWLDEMLNIEEEVKPYILYVRQAFQSALPVRKTVEFNPYRHSHDGVEFDPETVQDQDKWMRANVMRTLKRKIDRGEVDQVNTFCLDASGSMDHEPMRNLFKILYLLILGLEDRKSYDAVHFFNYYFVETADFSNSYTNRNLLFKILRRIATIGKDGVVYGGGGGTNISDGVDKCHERMLTFIEDLKSDDPERNIVSSLFVITDGEPSMGIMDLDDLRDFIQAKRESGDVAIKGIYIKPEDDNTQFIPYIFGDKNYVETTEFHDAVDKFVRIMTQTYKAQRKAFKWKKKQAKQKNI